MTNLKKGGRLFLILGLSWTKYNLVDMLHGYFVRSSKCNSRFSHNAMQFFLTKKAKHFFTFMHNYLLMQVRTHGPTLCP